MHMYCNLEKVPEQGRRHLAHQACHLIQLGHLQASAAMLWANSARAADVKEAIEGAAAAAQTAQGPPTILGLNLFEVLLLGAPPVLYLIFNVYRSQVNQQAKVRSHLRSDLRTSVKQAGFADTQAAYSCFKCLGPVCVRHVCHTSLPRKDAEAYNLVQLVDFVSILAAIVIFGNILSVLVFKVGPFLSTQKELLLYDALYMARGLCCSKHQTVICAQ